MGKSTLNQLRWELPRRGGAALVASPDPLARGGTQNGHPVAVAILIVGEVGYFLRRRCAANPASPVPRSTIVAGSGTT